MGVKTLSPAEFGKRHKELFATVVGGRAQALGAKTLSDKVHLDMAYARKEGDLALIYDNVQQVREEKKGAIPLQDAYDIDERLATEAAAQAARSSGGVLTPASARFLPEAFRGDYERVTGLKIDGKSATAVDGVAIKRTGTKVDVTIDFAKALAGATAKEVVLAVSDHFVLNASRVEPPADPALPPYWITISPRAGKMKEGTWLLDDSGMRGFTDPSHGHLIRAGSETLKFTDQNGKKAWETLTFTLDAVNDIGSVQKPPSAGTQKLRDAWQGFFKPDEASFDFADAVNNGKLAHKTLAEVRDVPGIKTLFSAIRENTGQSISKLVKEELLQFFYDKDSKSLAVLRSFDGELGGYLSIVDESKKRWVGGFRFADDGTIDWNER